MPKFEDLPMPAQNEIRQARGEAEEEHPQKTRMSLLQRLANVGLGRRDEDTEPPIAARASGPAMSPMPPLPERRPQRTVAQQMRRTGIGICPAARAAGTGRSRPPGTCCRDATGRRSFGYPGVPAAPGQLKFVTIRRTKKVPAFAAGTFVFASGVSRHAYQAIDIKRLIICSVVRYRRQNCGLTVAAIWLTLGVNTAEMG